MEDSLVNRYASYYASANIDSCVVQGNLWTLYNRMVIPVGPVTTDYSLSPQTASTLLKRFPKALLLRTQDGCDPSHVPSPWYAVVCRTFHDQSALPSKQRSEIKRGLSNCTVERISPLIISEQGYEVFAAAFANYKNVGKQHVSGINFSSNIMKSAEYGDIIHHWGIFNKGKLVGYAVNQVYGKEEVNYSTVKFHPEYLKLYPSYALFYTMNQYYLKEVGVKWVNDGFRNIMHHTRIQDFLIDKFGFEKAFSKLDIVYKPPVSKCIKVARPFKGFLKSLSPKISALLTLDSIANGCHVRQDNS